MSSKIFRTVLFAVLAFGFAAVTAHAANTVINGAKANCVIGERVDGYLGVVSGKTVTAAEQREMRSVNQQRKAAYAKIAANNGVTIEVAAALTAEKLIRQAPAGHCVETAAGNWTRK